MDVPYIPVEWNVIRDKAYAKNPNLTGMSVFGKYLSKMKLKQWRNYHWADSAALQQMNMEKNKALKEEQKAREAQAKEQFENGEISEAQYKTLVSAQTQNEQFKRNCT